MQLIYNNQQYHIDENNNFIANILKKINEISNDKDVVFSHLIINDVEVFENYEVFLKENINRLFKVEIVTKKMNEMLWDTMISINEYLQRAIPALKTLVNESYEKFNDETWMGINQLAEGMQWILQFSTFTREVPRLPMNWDKVQDSVQACEDSFAKLMEGVEVQDTVSISDILTYEVTPAYEQLQENLAIASKDEEFLKNVN
ncbi:hypothetical protein ACFSTA_14700 [Ornithinibacillus salinisoli]|uniref:Uncharacterized protein n=1 Tax=Ornithinibacillus salinisoli TaxID=1848459 RepID=A0ABW4W0R5_9BACI